MRFERLLASVLSKLSASKNQTLLGDKMLFEDVAFGPENRLSGGHQTAIFSNCSFEKMAVEGLIFDGALLSCRFGGTELYWSFFNTAVISATVFENCVFRGASFSGCSFVDCTFKNCQFAKDNLGGECSFDDCTLTECSFISCEFDRDKKARQKANSSSRFYACITEQCKGFQGLW
jgi:uncharacterized protein YjbI with pentapeptide repeats